MGMQIISIAQVFTSEEKYIFVCTRQWGLELALHSKLTRYSLLSNTIGLEWVVARINN